MAKLDFDALNAVQRYLQFAVFRAIPGALGQDRSKVIEEAQAFFTNLENEGVVTVRGIYDLSLIHISEPTRPRFGSRMPSSA